MFSRLIVKSISVLLICLLSLYVILPIFFDNKFFISTKRINLGLDLKAGASLLLNIDLDFYFKEKLGMLADEIKETLLAKNIECNVQNNEQIIVALSNPDDYKKASVFISKMNPNLELSKKDSSIFISYKPHYKNSLISEIAAESINNVQRRLDTLGTKEVSVQKQGQNKILVQVPGVENTEQIKSLLGKTAKLSFHLANNNVAKIQDIDHETTVLLKDSLGNSYPIFRKTEIGGDALVNASVRFGSLGKPTVHFKFDSSASKKFAKITKENVGKPFAIVLDNTVLTVPQIREPILNGEGEISGNFTEKQASELAILLKSGALPAPLKIIEEKNIGPSLGEESIKAGEMAAIISIIAVSLFIIITYGKLGLLAYVALLFNVILILLILTLLEATLTLPGIAGIALTVGMAVDANILIFERIREEIKSGKRVGFAAAFKMRNEGFNNSAGMVNVYRDFHKEEIQLTPYAGVGAGVAKVKFLGKTRYALAYQAKFGVNYPLTTRTQAFAGLRYFGILGNKFENVQPGIKILAGETYTPAEGGDEVDETKRVESTTATITNRFGIYGLEFGLVYRF